PEIGARLVLAALDRYFLLIRLVGDGDDVIDIGVPDEHGTGGDRTRLVTRPGLVRKAEGGQQQKGVNRGKLHDLLRRRRWRNTPVKPRTSTRPGAPRMVA